MKFYRVLVDVNAKLLLSEWEVSRKLKTNDFEEMMCKLEVESFIEIAKQPKAEGRNFLSFFPFMQPFITFERI